MKTIYAKTNAGRLLAFDNSQQLPAAMKNMLRRVDGKTTRQQLLVKPGDTDVLEELIQRQWVQVVSAAWRNSTYASGHGSEFTSDFGETQNPPTELDTLTNSFVDTFGSGGDQFASTEAASLDGDVAVSSSLKIESAKLLMSDFVTTHLPEYLDITLTEIMALRTKADLLCMLGAYIDMAHRKGKPGQQHIQQLLLTVADNE